uniref:gametocyte-specific factor 1 n=1 Tax=Euleptes europaea TaxID=460621 RepID=UPI0025405DAC|nr:gametocyte-specific factor 1 [Euleptes europaea]
MDPERLIQCPYDKNHQIRACRFPYHLVKCRENNKKIAKELATCPYNARHRVPRQELSLHIATCENKVSQELEGAASAFTARTREVTAFQSPPSQEDWEADAVEAPAPPFVFGASRIPRIPHTLTTLPECLALPQPRSQNPPHFDHTPRMLGSPTAAFPESLTP